VLQHFGAYHNIPNAMASVQGGSGTNRDDAARFKSARGGNGACRGNFSHAAAKKGDGASAESACEEVTVLNSGEPPLLKFR
jgi:hypothetical protein